MPLWYALQFVEYVMDLQSYMATKGLSEKQFAQRIGVKQGTVSRYATRDRVPHPKIMADIYSATGGAVEPNDFYELPRLWKKRD
jgi:transcriptional regulator with XRE-family HTH domain|tara:strand:- start:11 stop:262 length:252 start_codon:yes stop_codon:yes gene_type:complete